MKKKEREIGAIFKYLMKKKREFFGYLLKSLI